MLDKLAVQPLFLTAQELARAPDLQDFAESRQGPRLRRGVSQVDRTPPRPLCATVSGSCKEELADNCRVG